MTEHPRPVVSHWNYFLSLEDDISRLSRYVELHEDNYQTYSLELTRLLFSAASEVDVVARQLCERLDSGSNAYNIADFRKAIRHSYPQISGAIVFMPQFGLSMTPWENWASDTSPSWWLAYNNVKHHRHTHFSEASLQNALDAVAGLFVLLLFFYREEARTGRLSPDVRLFAAGPPFREDRLFWDEQAKVYLLDSDPRI